MKFLVTWLMVGACLVVVTILLWLDRHFQKSLRAVVPDPESLHEEPERIFTTREILIGPKKKYLEMLLSSLIWTVMATILNCIVSSIVLAIGFGILVGHMSDDTLAPWVGGVAAICLFGSLIASGFLLRGGTMVLTKEGVEFRDRTSAVFCPWMLLQAPQTVIGWDKKKVRFCVNSAAIPVVELRKADQVASQGRAAQNSLFSWEAETIVVLADDYEVKPQELQLLLLQLSAKLGTK